MGARDASLTNLIRISILNTLLLGVVSSTEQKRQRRLQILEKKPYNY